MGSFFSLLKIIKIIIIIIIGWIWAQNMPVKRPPSHPAAWLYIYKCTLVQDLQLDVHLLSTTNIAKDIIEEEISL